MAKEALLQKKILQFLNEQDIFNFKIISANKNGIPDIFFIYKGQSIFLEIKSPNGKASEIQKYQMQKIKENGAFALFIKNYSEFLQFFNNFKPI